MKSQMVEKVLEEFKGLTNDEAYVHVFSKRMMQPIPDHEGEFFGTDQRLYMLPYIKELVSHLPPNSQILDVGAGAGDVVDFALKDSPKGTIINIEEPNPALIQTYVEKVKSYPNLRVGRVCNKPVQDYYQGTHIEEFPKNSQNLVLSIHMIYHLTDFKNPKINPEKDLIDAISFLYGCLIPGGSIFIVYADLLDSPEGGAVCGLAEKYFRQKYPHECYADNLVSIYKARNHLLGPKGTIANILSKHYPKTSPKLKSVRRKSHFFGKSIEDIAVLALATELCPSDSNQFDLSKLQFCLDYIKQNPERIGLVKEEGNVPQKGLWRADEPEVIASITKERI